MPDYAIRHAGWALLVLAAGCASDTPSEAERLESRLDRTTAVHVHVALRAHLDGPQGAETARALAAAADERGRAAQLAETFFAERDTGRSRLQDDQRADRALSSRLAEDGSLSPETDRAAFFLALLAESVEDDHRIPKQILVYEASRIDPDEVSDPVLRRVARAASALVMARAGYCERVDEEVRAVRATETTETQVRHGVDRYMPEAALDPARLHVDLRRAVTVLVGGAEACCAMRRDRNARAAASVEAWSDEAEQLGVPGARVAILRAWAALARSDRDAARRQLERIREGEIPSEDLPRYAMIRDAFAADEPGAMRDATERLVDRRWISALVLSGAHQAFREDGLLEALAQQPEARALQRLAAGEAAMIAAARARYPMFDQTHAADRGPLDRLADLFR
ncbi:MAG TPA: hypothetical protein RMH99_00590 [Sandaracinaceae bacterium LLY-WYZ-13_1]|nr:hypothetical protein [Sandaracinaceae bacterium LLY-WYZ-13_1]